MTQAVVAGALAVAALTRSRVCSAAGCWYRERADCAPARAGFWMLLRVGQGSALACGRGRARSPPRVTTRATVSSICTRCFRSRSASSPSSFASPRPQTILDQRGLDEPQAVGALPEDEQRRIVAAIVRRETGVMALSALVVVFLALRAASTAHGF